MIDCFEVMYEEGADHPKLMSLALHDRLTGRPGRITGLIKFLDHITTRDRVWICTGREIAEHWRRVHPGLIGPPRGHESYGTHRCPDIRRPRAGSAEPFTYGNIRCGAATNQKGNRRPAGFDTGSFE